MKPNLSVHQTPTNVVTISPIQSNAIHLEVVSIVVSLQIATIQNAKTQTHVWMGVNALQ